MRIENVVLEMQKVADVLEMCVGLYKCVPSLRVYVCVYECMFVFLFVFVGRPGGLHIY